MTETSATTGLPNRYAEILAFERAGGWRHAGVKESVVRDRFDVSLSRYYQLLNHTIDLPAALRFDPTTVRRLLERRAATAAHRVGRHGYEVVQ